MKFFLVLICYTLIASGNIEEEINLSNSDITIDIYIPNANGDDADIYISAGNQSIEINIEVQDYSYGNSTDGYNYTSTTITIMDNNDTGSEADASLSYSTYEDPSTEYDTISGQVGDDKYVYAESYEYHDRYGSDNYVYVEAVDYYGDGYNEYDYVYAGSSGSEYSLWNGDSYYEEESYVKVSSTRDHEYTVYDNQTGEIIRYNETQEDVLIEIDSYTESTENGNTTTEETEASGTIGDSEFNYSSDETTTESENGETIETNEDFYWTNTQDQQSDKKYESLSPL